jgi:hypothetical protein
MPSTGKQCLQVLSLLGFCLRYPHRCRTLACRHHRYHWPSRRSLTRGASTCRLHKQPHSCVCNPHRPDNMAKTSLTFLHASPYQMSKPAVEAPTIDIVDLRQPPSVAPSTMGATPYPKDAESDGLQGTRPSFPCHR